MAPSLRSESDIDDLVEKVLDTLVSGSAKGAYRALTEHWALPPSELARRVVDGERERSAVRKQLGLSIGWEALEKDIAGTRLMRVRCLERFERGALLWSFIFYRANEVWLIDSIESSTDLAPAFEP